ncbi:MAG: hypothetical protein AAF572_19795 [Cyanobacteria bacterium P01_B01_bin.77]
MSSLVLLIISLGLIVLGQRLRPVDEVYPLALYSASLLSGLWGFAAASGTIQLAIVACALGYLQVGVLRA